jgi:type I restriction enzyme R subunit
VSTPAQQARKEIEHLLAAAGCAVQDIKAANIHAAQGVAVHPLYVNGKSVGVVEAKRKGATLTGVEIQSARYAQGVPTSLPAWRRPLPFVSESTGLEALILNGERKP